MAWIAYGMGGRWHAMRGLRAWWRLQWVVFVGLFPITLYCFGQISMVSLLANLPAIPWVGMVIVPVCLLACVSGWVSVVWSQWLFGLAGKLVVPLWWWLRTLSQGPHGVWHHGVNNPWILLSALVAAALCLAPKGFPGRRPLAVMWALPLFFYPAIRPPLGAVWLTVLDVGQGLSVVVQTAHHSLVYDTGPHMPGGFDTGLRVVLPYLRRQGLQQLDTLMISHGDNDHIGGAGAVLAAMPVQRILSSVPERFRGVSMAKRPVDVEACQAGQHWRWDGVDFRVLSPPPGEPYQGNNSSCVLKLSAHGQGILLMGDIEKSREKWLLAHRRRALRSVVVVAPHHGSISSSSVGFVRALAARDVLFPMGYYNRYGFPNPVVVSRYRAGGAQVYRSDRDGAIRVRISPKGVLRVSVTDWHQHYWQT